MSLRALLAGAALASAFTIVPAAAADDLVFLLDNQSNAAVSEFSASPVGAGAWESLLVQGTVDSGNFARLTIGGGRGVCAFDLKIVFADGRTVEDPGINLCDTGNYTVSN